MKSAVPSLSLRLRLPKGTPSSEAKKGQPRETSEERHVIAQQVPFCAWVRTIPVPHGSQRTGSSGRRAVETETGGIEIVGGQ